MQQSLPQRYSRSWSLTRQVSAAIASRFSLREAGGSSLVTTGLGRRPVEPHWIGILSEVSQRLLLRALML